MIIKQLGEMRSDHNCVLLFEDDFSDEYYWEFVDTLELIHAIIPIEYIHSFVESEGMILLEDRGMDQNRFKHEIRLTAWHHDPKWLTWIQMVKRHLDKTVE
jgi:hypothetical protein